jgi:hypothetical protein
VDSVEPHSIGVKLVVVDGADITRLQLLTNEVVDVEGVAYLRGLAGLIDQRL